MRADEPSNSFAAARSIVSVNPPHARTAVSTKESTVGGVISLYLRGTWFCELSCASQTPSNHWHALRTSDPSHFDIIH